MPKAKELSQETSAKLKVSQESKTIKKGKKKDTETSSQGSAADVTESTMPKKAISSYLCFINARRPGFNETNPDLSMCETVQALAKVWNAMDDDQKKQYDKIAAEDQKRFEKQTSELKKKGYFIDKDGQNSRQLWLQKERAKNAVKPKGKLSAYMYFAGENFKKLKAENADLKVTEGAKLNGAAWAKMDEAARKKFDDMHDADVARFDKQQAEIDKKGYFTLEDGSKSCDQIQKKFKYPKGTKMPERAQQAYSIYCQDNIDKIMSKQSLSKNEAQSVCSQVWEKLNEKQKLKYENLHQEDTKRYEKQVVCLQQKGFYVNEDGTKSTA